MISVNASNNTITGSIDGKKFELPFKEEWNIKLKKKALEANAQGDPNDYKIARTSFQNSVNAMIGASKNKKEVKVGDSQFTVAKAVEVKAEVVIEANEPQVVEKTKKPVSVYKTEEVEQQHYLTNGKVLTKFYLPKGLLDRIEESISKDVDPTPLYKFFIRANRNPKMTQDKMNRLVDYINKTFVDQDYKEELIARGHILEEATKLSTGYQVGITQEGLLVTYKASQLISESNTPYQVQETTTTSGCKEPDEDDFYDEDDDFEQDRYDQAVEKWQDCLDKETPDEEGKVEVKEEVDITEFVYKPIRNKKGHFYAKGSQEYLDEYNKQLDEFKAGLPTEVKAVTKTDQGAKVEANIKYAEDFTFEPPMMHKSGDAFYCGDVLGHEIKVGKVHKLPDWKMVDTNDKQCCLPGLHVGGLDYITGYRNGDYVVHNIFVDPQHIGAVVSVETGDGAMRVKEYFVHSCFLGPNRGLYNSSDYAKQSDEEWNKMIEEATKQLDQIKQDRKVLDELEKEANEVLEGLF
jgi:hypothetical protein